MQRLRKTYPKTAMIAVIVLAGAMGLWLLAGIPALVKYPTDLDVSPRYEGTFALLVDPATAAPLEEAVEVPMVIERQIRALPDESGANRVVVEETIVQRAGDLVNTTQTNVYVMDRSTLENVADDRAYAFTPENVVDRSGAYRLNLPFDVSQDERYEMYKNEIGGTYELWANAEDPSVELEGLDLDNYLTEVSEAPLDEAYLAELNRVVPLPESLTLEQLDPQLRAAGIDVGAVLAALGPVLTPEDAATLAAFAADPIGLDYVLSFGGRVAVEPMTGAEVRVAVEESVGARPRLDSLPALLEVLGHYPDVPEAVAAIEGLDRLTQAPATPLFAYSYEQTPESVAEIADEVASMRSEVRLAKVWLPVALAAGAGLAFLIGLFVAFRRQRVPAMVAAPEGLVLTEVLVPTEVRAEGTVQVTESEDKPIPTG